MSIKDIFIVIVSQNKFHDKILFYEFDIIAASSLKLSKVLCGGSEKNLV